MKLLLIDTATELCSAGLYCDGQFQLREQELARGHGAVLLPMIDSLLAEAGVKLSQLNAIAFGRGPGGFTGVRLAASVAQGLAFGAGLPVLPVSNLLSVAQLALDAEAGAAQVLVCNDARMGEVYCGLFQRNASGQVEIVGAEAVLPPTEVTPHLLTKDAIVIGAGRGFRAYPALALRFGGQLQSIADDILPSVRGMLSKALTDWRAGLALPATAAQPVYLRDNVARPAVTGLQ